MTRQMRRLAADFGTPTYFAWKVSLESSAEVAMQARSAQFIRKDTWVC